MRTTTATTATTADKIAKRSTLLRDVIAVNRGAIAAAARTTGAGADIGPGARRPCPRRRRQRCRTKASGQTFQGRFFRGVSQGLGTIAAVLGRDLNINGTARRVGQASGGGRPGREMFKCLNMLLEIAA